MSGLLNRAAPHLVIQYSPLNSSGCAEGDEELYLTRAELTYQAGLQAVRNFNSGVPAPSEPPKKPVAADDEDEEEDEEGGDEEEEVLMDEDQDQEAANIAVGNQANANNAQDQDEGEDIEFDDE